MFALLLGGAARASQPSPALPSPRDLAQQIYALDPSPQLVLYLTGGGAQLAPWVLATAGASRSVLELRVPYSERALAQLLAKRPARYCAPDVARKMARAAYLRAGELAAGAARGPRVGLGCTAALRSERPRRGEHRCYIAVYTERGLHELSLKLAKDARSRELEDAVVARCALLALAASCGITVEGAREFWRLWPGEGDDAPKPRAERKALGLHDISQEELQWSFREHLNRSV
ncbi:hypothetical protein AB1Y20_019733 [Prymnesium parvum]|uniref:Uncharacterized protein n=1 Tax=Prymnesium parvum TaxID=97485 RepID=A0AB34JRW7_PRYPA